MRTRRHRADEGINFWPAVADVFIGILAFVLVVALLANLEAAKEHGVEPPPAKREFARAFEELVSSSLAEAEAEMIDSPEIEDLGFSEVKIYYPASFLFDSCRIDLKASAARELGHLKLVLNNFDDEIARVQITGHTDSDRPSPGSYCYIQGITTNWELSARRAITVLHLLAPDDQTGLDPGKVWGAALGEYHPVATDGSEYSKERNRRIEIVVRFKEVFHNGYK